MTDGPLHRLLDEAAVRAPGLPAVTDGERTLCYEELARAANRVANALISLGVTVGDRVGLWLDKSLESLIGLYGILKAGGVYVPLDDQAPPGRIAAIASQCGLRCLLTGSEKAGRVEELAKACAIEAVVVLNARTPVIAPVPDCLGIETLERQADSHPNLTVGPGDLAYLLYTSGSTGVPKGVAHTHSSALAFVGRAARALRIEPEDKLLSYAPLHLDLSTFDIFAAAASCATVVLAPRQASIFPALTVRFVEATGVSVWQSVPWALRVLLRRGGLREASLPRLRMVLFAGEVFPSRDLCELMTILPTASHYNVYGATEINSVLWYRVPAPPPPDAPPVPIGWPMEDVEAAVLDTQGEAVPPGEVGELYVSGPTVMTGYWAEPELTERVLARSIGKSGNRSYRTGDLVLQDAAGGFHFRGRTDDVVKSRGYRVDPGDIEVVLAGHPDVLECAVTAVPDDTITNRIDAHLVVTGKLDRRSLIRHCSERLPPYMVPAAFVSHDMLPRTPSGKVDKRALLDGGPDTERRWSE